MNKYNHGFTLIELIVTLAVVGILFAVALPNIMFTTTTNRLSSQYNDMRGDFAFARNLAITQNVAVNISSNNGTNWSNGWVVTTPTKTVRISKVANNVIISSAITNLTYNADGTANVAGPTSLKLCDDRVGTYGKQLNVILAGRVSLSGGASCP